MPERFQWMAPRNPTAVFDTASGTVFHLVSGEEACALTNMLNYLDECAHASEEYFPHMENLTTETHEWMTRKTYHP